MKSFRRKSSNGCSVLLSFLVCSWIRSTDKVSENGSQRSASSVSLHVEISHAHFRIWLHSDNMLHPIRYYPEIESSTCATPDDSQAHYLNQESKAVHNC